MMELKRFEELPKVVDTPEWYREFIRTKDGAIKEKVLTNVTLIFENDPLFKNLFKFNTFAEEQEMAKDLQISGGVIQKGTMHDVDALFLIAYIERTYRFTVTEPLMFSAVSMVSQIEASRYNPTTDYFDYAETIWDRKERASTFLADFLGAPKSDITTLITNIFFIGAVAKAYNPMTKFDFSLDIVGDQGTGKTTLLKKLGREFYVDTIQDFKNKDEYIKMQRALIVHDDEMQATNSSGFDVLKKFLSTEMLEYRAPYGRKSVRHARHFVVARTSNQVDYLKDKTGNRRFLPILSSREKQVKHPYTDLTDELVTQFWGEMVNKYKTIGVQYPTLEQSEALEKYREDFVYVDEIENQINIFLDSRIEEWVASSDIAEFGLNIENLAKNQSIARKINNVMNNKSDWRKGRKGNGRVWWKN